MLVLYAGLIQRSESSIALAPSQSTYEELFAKYSDTLQCPCSTISIVQQDFISHLDASLHPVCSSDLVTEQWWFYLHGYRGGDPPPLPIVDFRRWGLLLFTMLTSLCSMANETLTIAIRQYQSDRFISNQVLHRALFNAESNARMQQFQVSTSSVFRSLLGTIRIAAQGNALMTVLETNWISKLDQYVPGIPLLTVPVVYNNNNCTCATSSSCVGPAAFFTSSGEQYYTAEHIYHGCTPLDSILMSRLSCFFSQSCLESFLAAIPLHTANEYWGGEIFPMTPLNFSSNGTRFRVNDTLETIVNTLFIDSWSSTITYAQYFNACQPSHCTYVLKQRLDVVFVGTTFISVFSGLSTIIRVSAPHLIAIFEKLSNRFHRIQTQAT